VRRAPAAGRRKALLALLAVTVLKLWLVAVQPLYACSSLPDDVAFLRLGASIASGQWLGSYDQYTLIKGPVYPAFLAWVAALGAPLLLSQQLVYALACAAFALALRPLAHSRTALVGLYLLLLLDPASFAGDQQRVAREGIYPAETLLVFAALGAVLARRLASLPLLLSRCAGLGVALSLFWLTREEGVWLAAPLAIALAWLAWDLARRRTPDRALRLACLLVPIAFVALASAALVRVNRERYGVPARVELDAPQFAAAIGALMRASPDSPDAAIPVPSFARQRLYPLSPAFRELEPFLEGPSAQGFARRSQDEFARFPGEREILGSWWVWAVRDAAARSGHHASGAEAMRFYAQLAQEIDAACSQRQVPCGPQRSALYPPLRIAYLPSMLGSAGSLVARLVRMNGLDPRAPPSPVRPGDIELFERGTRNRIEPPAGAPPSALPAPYLAAARVAALEGVASAFEWLAPLLGAAGLAAFGLAVATPRRVVVDPLFLVCAVLLAAVLARIALLSVIDVVSFPTGRPRLLAPLYPLWLAFCALSLDMAVALRGAAGAQPSGPATPG